jgi:hypothetical protein
MRYPNVFHSKQFSPIISIIGGKNVIGGKIAMGLGFTIVHWNCKQVCHSHGPSYLTQT